jgi:hypothetical protein
VIPFPAFTFAVLFSTTRYKIIKEKIPDGYTASLVKENGNLNSAKRLLKARHERAML